MLKRKLPSPITILMGVIILAALCTWLIPAGKYNTLSYKDGTTFQYSTASGDTTLNFSQATLDSLHIKIPLKSFQDHSIRKPVSVPGSYHKLESKKQGFLEILQAPVKGVNEAIDIIFFILVIGGFMQVFNESGAMVRGLSSLSYRMNGKESWLIIILGFLFSFAGASYGMAEEAFVFYAVLVPVFLAAGYDLIVPVAVIFGGTQLGTLSSFSNPFSTIIASNAAGISWKDGFGERIIMFALTTIITIWYIVRYANKVKRDPSSSLVYKIDGIVKPPFETTVSTSATPPPPLGTKTSLLLLLFLATFLTMIAGVVWFDWWLPEMTTLFIGSAILLAIILRMKESNFIHQFIKGCEGLLSVALIVGVARGVTIILNDGQISDSIVYYAAQLVSTMPPALFILMMLLLFVVFTLFISSSSGMAVLTMPIMGSLAMLVNVPGREIVNAYLFGMGIMGFITPTGLILPSLALVNVSIKTWWKFIWPLLLMLTIVCMACLVIGIYLK
jgi:uncharacterized ion transporter superfamily protein YfcC